MEGSGVGAGYVPLTNRSGFGMPKNIGILRILIRIRIRITAFNHGCGSRCGLLVNPDNLGLFENKNLKHLHFTFEKCKRLQLFRENIQLLKLKILHFFLFYDLWSTDPGRFGIQSGSASTTLLLSVTFFPDGLFFVAASSACPGWRVSRLSQPAVWLPRTRDDRSPSLAVLGAWDSSPAAVHRFLLLLKTDMTGLHRWIGLGYDSVADPWHFGTDPDPRIRTYDNRIRIRFRLLLQVFFLTFWRYIYIIFQI